MAIGDDGVPELLNLGGGKNGVSIPTMLALDENDGSVKAWGGEVSRYYKGGEGTDGVKIVSNFKRYFGAAPRLDAPDEEKNANDYAYLFLKKLAESVMQRFNVEKLDPDDYAACIGHPAGWDESRVEALRQCAISAGFPVEKEGSTLYNVEEPVAAMHALRVTDDLGFKFNNEPEHYLVIDFGGGTLDVCVVKTGILGQSPVILSTAGDPNLGGKDFDNIMKKLFFRNNSLIEEGKIRPLERSELDEKIREAKESIALTLRENQSSTQAFNLQSGQYSLTVTKGELDGIINEMRFKEKITEALHDSLKKADVNQSKIKKVILTGGSSKWWFVKELVAKEFAIHGDNIYETQNPFTDVATGSAVKIGLNAGQSADKKGVWVRFSLDGGKNGKPKIVFNPHRGVAAASKEKLHLGTLPSSKSLKPYIIRLQFQTGFSEEELGAPEEAVVEFYARSNQPRLRKLANALYALKGKEVKALDDQYHVYLYAEEDNLGGIKWKLQITDFNYSERKKSMLDNDAEQAKKMPEGRSSEVDVIYGQIASRSIFGLRRWKREDLKTTEQTRKEP